MKRKVITLLLSSVLAASLIGGCGKTAADNPNNTQQANEQAGGNAEVSDTESAETPESGSDSQSIVTQSQSEPTTYEELIASLHAGQYYAYAPVCKGDDALLVTSYTFSGFNDQPATYEATIYTQNDGALKKVTTVQSGGTAYPIALTKDNNLIMAMRNSIETAYVDKAASEFVITADSHVDYLNAENGEYHNFKKDSTDLPADSSLFDELSAEYEQAEAISFTGAGIAADGTPNLAGAVYAAYEGDDLSAVNSYIIFDDAASGHTQTPDGAGAVPFSYEQSGENITFHFGSADDNTEATFGSASVSFPTLTFSGENIFRADLITLVCLGNADSKNFDAARYYDNDNSLLMQVKSFDEKSVTGDTYREERIGKNYIEKAAVGGNVFSSNGTPFTVTSFEEANKELGYGTDEEFKQDVVGSTRFDKFLVKCGDDDSYYALEKEDYEDSYKVVSMMTDETLKKCIEKDVTFSIKENAEITLLKFVEVDDVGHLESVFITGREFEGDNYPGWSEDASEYFMTDGMLIAVSVVDGELYNFVQIYVP